MGACTRALGAGIRGFRIRIQEGGRAGSLGLEVEYQVQLLGDRL